MSIGSWLHENASHDTERGLWRLNSGATVAYPNDDFAERELEPILRSATDISSLSPELAARAMGWPASYYLSPRRTNLLRGFEWDSGAKVIEVGAGCGSITRFLGETFDEVLAVEGQSRRAEIAALRTRDLDGVQVLNAPIQDVDVGPGFDLVFCVGVLEYAPMFVPSNDPFKAMLEHLRGHLTDGGSLVLAIENQMGMKYFAGSAEDHSGIAFDGIEGYQRSGGTIARTFSRSTLVSELSRAGFGSNEFFYPFPDYKLVDSVATDAAFENGSDSLASFLVRSQPVDYLQPPTAPLFDQRAAMSEAITAGLGAELSNSFLVVATSGETDDSSLIHRGWDAVAFTIGERQPGFWTRTEVTGMADSNATVSRSSLLGEVTDPIVGTEVSSLLPVKDTWYPHATLGTRFAAASKAWGNDLTCISAELAPWIRFLQADADGRGLVGGGQFDAIPQNMILEDGECHCIDLEFGWKGRIPLQTVVLRGLIETIFEAEATPGALKNQRGKLLWPLVGSLGRELGVPLSVRDLFEAKKIEVRFQKEVRGVEESWNRAAVHILRYRISGSTQVGRLISKVNRKVREKVHAARR